MSEHQPMTAEQMAEIAEALDAATPGPWQAYREGEVDFFGGEDGAYCFPADDFEPADAHLIANAPTWLRSLLAEAKHWKAQSRYEYELSCKLQDEARDREAALTAEVQRLQTEYADERASHNAHVAELLAAEAEVKRLQASADQFRQLAEGMRKQLAEIRRQRAELLKEGLA